VFSLSLQAAQFFQAGRSRSVVSEGAFCDVVDVALRYVADAPSGAAAECFVGAGEGVDAVVVGGVWEGAELVEEFCGVGAADEFDQAVFGGGGGDAGADLFGAGGALAADDVAAQDVLFVPAGDGAAGGAGFFFDDDLDLAAISGGGGGDKLLDRARGFADADEVGQVVDAAGVVEFESQSDAVVGIWAGVAGFGRGEIPVANGAAYGREPVSVDLLEPGALEELALVRDVPVTSRRRLCSTLGRTASEAR
jgi:hypothetical protein